MNEMREIAAIYKSEQAQHAIRDIDSSINTDWLEMLTVDTDRIELTKDYNAQMTKSFIRGLMAAKAVGIELLDDLER